MMIGTQGGAQFVISISRVMQSTAFGRHIEAIKEQSERSLNPPWASERMWKCEGLFAEAKQYHRLSRAKYRSRPKVQIQAYPSAIVQNLKRLLFPLYCWLVACSWRLTHATALPTASNPQSIKQMPAGIRLFQHAPPVLTRAVPRRRLISMSGQ